ncbi:hypothetical protein AB162_050 [Candidatus Palibaumannia cicadellinicola]|uniref:Uncharacterized protein n=1 Tax=Candidatus Palibaumannia cicadellinicola TaxID=186490 RepID=A0A0K2BKV6_9GAMM|nr:hypothetical protein AB162_050 [Candidatus Baumannia cicadellinicola]
MVNFKKNYITIKLIGNTLLLRVKIMGNSRILANNIMQQNKFKTHLCY